MKFSLLTLTICFSMATLSNIYGCPTGDTEGTVFQYTIEDLNAAMPMKKDKDSCKEATDTMGCVTNEKALQPLNDALKEYKITTRGEAVGLLAYMMYESGNFNTYMKADVPGQGTYNMQHFLYNYNYLKEKDKENFDITAKGYPVDDPEKLQNKQYDPSSPLTQKEKAIMGVYLDMVFNAKLEYGSAFWYLNTVAPACKPKLVEASADGFKDFIMHGVKVKEWDERRAQVWTSVNEVVHK